MNLRTGFKGALVATIVAGGLAVGALGALGAAYADGGDQTPQSTSTQDPAPPYKPPHTNARGQTYGSALGATTYAQVPDLVSVWDNQGQMGYARKTDIFPSAFPGSTSGASALQQGDLSSSFVTVYESDGVTVMGTYGGWN